MKLLLLKLAVYGTLFALPLLAGCKTTEEIAAEDNATCQSYGAKPGSDAYVNCRVAQESIRAQEDIAGAQQAMAANQAYWNTVNGMRAAYNGY